MSLDKVWAALQTLADEDPALQILWGHDKQDISVQLMGELHRQTVEQLLKECFGLDIKLTRSGFVYQETISKAGEGIGHFEPLRHYAEVHLWLETLSAGSGLQFANKCDQEVLAKNWQQQVLTALRSKTLHGVLLGANLTDVKITLLSGHASIIHSVGGDFREAAWRAVRQGLMELRQRKACVLLEPYYHFEIVLPAGQGSIELTPAASRPCHGADEVIAKSDYDPVKTLADTPNSVFCAHGAGHTVNWADVPTRSHIPPLAKWISKYNWKLITLFIKIKYIWGVIIKWHVRSEIMKEAYFVKTGQTAVREADKPTLQAWRRCHH